MICNGVGTHYTVPQQVIVKQCPSQFSAILEVYVGMSCDEQMIATKNK